MANKVSRNEEDAADHAFRITSLKREALAAEHRADVALEGARKATEKANRATDDQAQVITDLTRKFAGSLQPAASEKEDGSAPPKAVKTLARLPSPPEAHGRGLKLQ